MNTTTQLAAQAMRGDAPAAKVAHAALFERIIERIHRYFTRMLRQSHDAEECLQQTLMLLEQSLVHGKYDPTRSFNTWMWLKAHTVWAQWCRSHTRRPAALPDEELVGQRSGAQERVEQRLDAARVLEAVRERLGDETYEAFVLYYEGGLTQAEVAEAQGHDRKTIRKRIAAAHALIDRLLRGDPDTAET
ncbi:MAG: sigma-70 family RNA polymerase sigma factor [Planctomycetota bacterium]|nr:MAG: sigma-70 family RNA polymerase sigma factor [Planctomycetota bacterium]